MFFRLFQNKRKLSMSEWDMREFFLRFAYVPFVDFQQSLNFSVCLSQLSRQTRDRKEISGASGNCNKGFTLIEMMVVISIISIMSVIVISNYNAQRKSKELSFSAQKLAEDVRKAKNYSINVLKYGAVDTSGGYGIHLSNSAPNQYIIFLDTESVLPKDRKYSEGSDVKVETVVFPDIIGNMNGGSVTDADVIFLPPYGKTHISFNGMEQTGATLEVNLTKDAKTKTVRINHEGKIDE
jgi:prepilin-type N-terminal cleavage/methylation domain-containing protein